MVCGGGVVGCGGVWRWFIRGTIGEITHLLNKRGSASERRASERENKRREGGRERDEGTPAEMKKNDSDLLLPPHISLGSEEIQQTDGGDRQKD